MLKFFFEKLYQNLQLKKLSNFHLFSVNFSVKKWKSSSLDLVITIHSLFICPFRGHWKLIKLFASIFFLLYTFTPMMKLCLLKIHRHKLVNSVFCHFCLAGIHTCKCTLTFLHSLYCGEDCTGTSGIFPAQVIYSSLYISRNTQQFLFCMRTLEEDFTSIKMVLTEVYNSLQSVD